MQKKAKDRAFKSTRFMLTSDEPFDTFKAQVLVKISDLLKPAILHYEDYEITYMIKYINVIVTQKRKPTSKTTQPAKQANKEEKEGKWQEGKENGGIHILLGHTHFTIWASAIVREDDTASFDTPPNHYLFDDIPDSKKASTSPLLKA
ncbi:hypothetical protein ACEPAF_7364 [Sanghuangporus sanghuang]